MKASLHLALATAFLAMSITAASAQNKQALSITNDSLERCVADEPCTLQLRATGGAAPLNWHIARGVLPPGLELDPAHGIISGSSTAAGDYEVVIEVSDSSRPEQRVSRLFTAKMIPPLAMDWRNPPALQGTTLSGSITVSNNGADALDLTFIAVAVNETGKAFALGYQHFNLAAKTSNQEIPFESQLPAGRYTVRADAIGEVAARQKIYRAARNAGPFQLLAQ
jgi:Putative Ig domain